MEKEETNGRPKEKTRLTIEFADNGIILRNPELEDEVTLALTKETTSTSFARAHDLDHSEEYHVIGKKIYDWLREVLVSKYSDDIVITGAEIDITATLNGRLK